MVLKVAPERVARTFLSETFHFKSSDRACPKLEIVKGHGFQPCRSEVVRQARTNVSRDPVELKLAYLTAIRKGTA